MTSGSGRGRPRVRRLLTLPRNRADSPQDRPPPGASSLLLGLLLVSLGILFAAAITAHVIIRLRVPGGGAIPLPAAFWPATAALLAASVALEAAVRAARCGERSRITRAAITATALGAVFLLFQVWGWSAVLSAARAGIEAPAGRVRAVQLVFLTGLHAAHVAGGLAALLRVSIRALAGGYGPGRELGLRLAARYWHFLGVVWIVLLVVFVSVG